MNTVWRRFAQCAFLALRGNPDRNFYLGAIAIRTDGAVVESYNLITRDPDPNAHAEYRLTRKVDYGSVVYVARIVRKGQFALAKPCQSCMLSLVHHGVKRIYYTINSNEYGVIDVR